MLGVNTRIGKELTFVSRIVQNSINNLRCVLPAIVEEYNYDNQTVTVQPTIREKLKKENGEIYYQQYPLLINVPVIYFGAGTISMFFPIKPGDECLVLFSDLSIDNWWIKGGIQDPVEGRRHDLSDGIAIFGLRSLPNKLAFPENKYGIFDALTNSGMMIDQEGNIDLRGASLKFNGESIVGGGGTATPLYFEIDSEGHLIMYYTDGAAPPDMYINDTGHLIWNYK